MQLHTIFRPALAACAAVVLLCTPPPPLSTIPAPSALSAIALLSEVPSDFQGFGALTLAHAGEVNRLFLTVINRAGQFQALLQSPFGQTLASLEADEDSARLELGDSLHVIGRNQPVPQLGGILQFPFTFDDLARILMGRLPESNLLSSSPDTLFFRRGVVHYLWRVDGMPTEIAAARSGARLKSVQLTFAKPATQRLVLSSFRACLAHEIHFRLDEKNYFTVKYERIKAGGR